MDIITYLLSGGTGAVVAGVLLYERVRNQARQIRELTAAVHEQGKQLERMSQQLLRLEVTIDLSQKKP